jgi:hypothetical protein
MLATTQPIKRWWTVSSAVLQSTHFSLWGRPCLPNLSAVQILPRIKSQTANLCKISLLCLLGQVSHNFVF